eukprot:gnl/Ergobibamus_cyprinoides/2701.p2 GENE.gnl/Ergobibamus_cyprinoides/2701~~gnl/Ergobibamus_cyprinoides/2701.p2  ORF type:complete len:104 (+),score=43.56 gnl/Ergobibamus_cyprinoides/2701:153-464(+)
MLGDVLVTKQTGPEGKLVRKVYLEDCAPIKRELYLSIIMDRSAGGPCLIASTEGGVDIETVAEHTPERIFTIPVDIRTGLTKPVAMDLAMKLGFTRQLDQVRR